jgi:SAM-dependent methyltransferase
MKNTALWRETKYAKNKNGHWGYSRNPRELSVSSRLIAGLIAKWYEQHIPQYVQGKLLDLGCGKAPLFGIYHLYASEVYCVDWENSLHENRHLDAVCNLNRLLPLPDESFDAIILSDVLEHIAEPKLLFSEMHRILRTGGKILLNVPFYYPLHEEPYDYFRYTRFALRKFADDARLKVVKLTAAGGALIVMTDIMSKFLMNIPVVGRYIAAILQNTAHGVWGRSPQTNEKLTTNFPLTYFVIMEK